jgi:mycothiol synthase
MANRQPTTGNQYLNPQFYDTMSWLRSSRRSYFCTAYSRLIEREALSQRHSADSTTTDMPAGDIDWVFRPFIDEDAAGMTALVNSVYESYKVPMRTTEEDFRARLGGPRSDPGRQWVVVEAPHLPGVPENMPAGYGGVRYDEDEEAGKRMYFLRVVVHKEAESLGLERAIAGRLMGIIRGYQSDPEMKPLPRAVVKAWAFEQFHPTRALWEEMGLREVRRFWTMVHPLDEPVDEPNIVEGVTIRSYRNPADNEGVCQTFNASFSDHWDYYPMLPEDWDNWMKQPAVRTDLSLLAEIDGKPGAFAGFCMTEINANDNKLRGVSEGWIELLGTIRGWRRMGLGRSLLLHGLHSLRSAGMDTALLRVDSQSPTGAHKLYESTGFRIRSREFTYACDLEDVRL